MLDFLAASVLRENSEPTLFRKRRTLFRREPALMERVIAMIPAFQPELAALVHTRLSRAGTPESTDAARIYALVATAAMHFAMQTLWHRDDITDLRARLESARTLIRAASNGDTLAAD